MVRLNSYYDNLMKSIDKNLDNQVKKLELELKEMDVGSIKRRVTNRRYGYSDGDINISYSTGMMGMLKPIIKFIIFCVCAVIIFTFVSKLFNKSTPVPPPLNPPSTEAPVKPESLNKL